MPYARPDTGEDDDTKQAAPAASSTPTVSDWLGGIGHTVASDVEDAGRVVSGVGRNIADLVTLPDEGGKGTSVAGQLIDGSDSSKADDKKKDDKKKSDDKDSTVAPTEDTYEQLADQQAQQFLAMSKALDPLTSGSAIPANDNAISGGAEAMLGTSSTSPISQWLNQQTAAAQAQFGPTAQASQGVAAAMGQANQLEAQGLQGMGKAEAESISAAPYQQLLQSLASEVPYHLAESWSLPGLEGQNVPAFLQQAETAAGVSTQGQGTGVTGTPTLPLPTASVVPSTSATTPETSAAPQS